MPNYGVPVPRCLEFNSTYARGCRCAFCREEHRKRRKQQLLRAAARERGVEQLTDRVSAQPSRELVLRALSSGASLRELQRVTGVSDEVIANLRDDKVRYVIRRSHNLIRDALQDNTDARSFQAGTRVDLAYTRAMIHGLMAQGWTADKQRELLASNLGITAGFIKGVMSSTATGITYENEQHIRWLVSEIGEAQGPSSRSRSWARINGYFPTKHYDNDGRLIVKSLPRELRQGIESV